MRHNIRVQQLIMSLTGAGLIFVVACGGGADSSNCAIHVDSFTPMSGKVGDTVTITGENLGGTAANVGFSGAIATPATGATNELLTVMVPLGAHDSQITVDDPVHHPECQGISQDTFTVTP